ncbi:MAG: hypothetical protein JNL90_15140 [Planctomycetes bacterium]|nr:hypothetical protein [Planctomycetota bacterium]
MVAWLLAFCLAWLGAAQECPDCKPTTPCGVHQKAESEALAAFAAKLKSKDPFERSAALGQIAELDGARPFGPSTDAAKLVASALDDEKVVVRQEAAKRLAGMHADVALPALLGALEATTKELAKLPSGRGDWGGGGGRGGPGGGAGGGGPGGGGPGGGGGGGRGGAGGGGGAPEDGKPEDPKVLERRKLREELNGLSLEIVNGLAPLPDDRTVVALAELLPTLSRWNEALLGATVDGLLRHGARKGAEAVVAKLNGAPIGEGRFGGPDPTGPALREALAKSALKQGAEPLPDWSTEEKQDWDKWFAKNQKHYVAKLGKWTIASQRAAKS